MKRLIRELSSSGGKKNGVGLWEISRITAASFRSGAEKHGRHNAM